MLVVAAPDIRIILERAGQERPDRFVRPALHAAQQADAGLGQRGLRAAADAAANQRIHALRRQEARKRPMPAAIGINDPRGKDCLLYTSGEDCSPRFKHNKSRRICKAKLSGRRHCHSMPPMRIIIPAGTQEIKP